MNTIVFLPRSRCRFVLDRHDIIIMKRLFIYFFGVVTLFLLCRPFSMVNDAEYVERAFNELSNVGSQLQYQINEINEVQKPNSYFRNYDKIKIDWHDYKYINAEKNQLGIGEHGNPSNVSQEEEPERERMALIAGFNALLSDRIALNRSIPDIRHKDCHNKKYLFDLPSVSVIIPFRREHFSTLLRTVYSVLNRSPPHLIKEILLVDDASQAESLGEPLEQHLKKYIPKAKIVRIENRVGLIRARMAGAKKATGDVYVFLDSHCEASTNWLPPLLEPIAENYKVVMCPLIDIIDHHTFEYIAQDEGMRGAFDWSFQYKKLNRLPEDLEQPSKPFRSPVMAGGLFAISSKYFWELGGYDEGLDIWGGEQYELSFKLWQCGGEMYDAPCSRVGHVYRGPTNPEPEPRDVDFLHINYKRVAEVWMDEYKEYLYMREPIEYAEVEAGDITKMKAIRQKLECRSFKWFMKYVAFDVEKMFPLIEPPDYAWGAIQSISHPNYCVDFLNRAKKRKEIGIWECGSIERPSRNQFFALTAYKDIRDKLKSLCWDAFQPESRLAVFAKECHRMKGNQLWAYDYKKNWIKQGDKENGFRCLEIDVKNQLLLLSECDDSNKNMLFKFSNYNATALDNFDTNPIYQV